MTERLVCGDSVYCDGLIDIEPGQVVQVAYVLCTVRVEIEEIEV